MDEFSRRGAAAGRPRDGHSPPPPRDAYRRGGHSRGRRDDRSPNYNSNERNVARGSGGERRGRSPRERRGSARRRPRSRSYSSPPDSSYSPSPDTRRRGSERRPRHRKRGRRGRSRSEAPSPPRSRSRDNSRRSRHRHHHQDHDHSSRSNHGSLRKRRYQRAEYHSSLDGGSRSSRSASAGKHEPQHMPEAAADAVAVARREPARRKRHRDGRRRRKTRRRARRRRSPSSSPSSSATSSSSSRSPSRPKARARRPTGVVSDDEAANGGGGASKTDGAKTTAATATATGATNEFSLPESASSSTRALTNKARKPQARSATSKKEQQQQQHSSQPRRDDTEGHFEGVKGSVIADRYKILRQVGVGTFGRVVECLDLKRNQAASSGRSHPDHAAQPFVALKIVRKIKRYYESALIEARIVDAINRRGGRGRTHCVVMFDAFSFDGHYCMVFESLGPSLYDFLKRHDYQPFPMVCVQDFALQLLEAMEFLHSFRLIHTDLKIENVLLVNDREVKYGNQLVPESTRLKLIDFGGACYDSDKKSSVINTRQYRAPEVILGTGWSMPSDMWSVGCILAELYQGELLFATHDNLEHVALMERIIGPFPRRMIQVAKSEGSSQSELAQQAFDSNERHRMERVLDADNAAFVRQSPRLEQLMRSPDDAWFFELLRKILVIDPTERATAHECLQFLSRIRRIRRDELRCG